MYVLRQNDLCYGHSIRPQLSKLGIAADTETKAVIADIRTNKFVEKNVITNFKNLQEDNSCGSSNVINML